MVKFHDALMITNAQLLDKLTTSLRGWLRTNREKQQSLALDIIAVSNGLRPAACLDVIVPNPRDLANTLAQDCPQLCVLNVPQQMQTFVVHRRLAIQVLQKLSSNTDRAICIDARSEPPVILVRLFSSAVDILFLALHCFDSLLVSSAWLDLRIRVLHPRWSSLRLCSSNSPKIREAL